MGTPLTPWVTLAVAGSLVGCSSATIQRRDGAVFEGEIVGGDREHLVVDEPMTGRRLVVPRDEVVDIQHGGGGWILAGGGLLGLGTVWARKDHIGALGFGGLSLIAGVGLLVTGVTGYLMSQSAADPEAGMPPTLHLTPAGFSVAF